ncbi:MAG TPA: phosphoribosylformylglycinamidine synthase subunit PurS [Abditibacterium sp.]
MPLAEIHVTLKPALFDAQGETIKKALHQLGHSGVQNARIGKYITLQIEGEDPATLQSDLALMCQQLLANPVIEDFQIALSGLPAPAFDPIEDVPAPPVYVEETPLLTDGEAVTEPVTIQAVTAQPTATRTETEAIITSRESGGPGVAASVSGGVEAVTTTGGVPVIDPFTVDFRSYQGMPTEAKLALRSLSLRKHGAWIEQQLAENRASWILCVGRNVVESGASLDSYPTDQHLLKLGVHHDLVPWIFTRPAD